MLLGGPGDNLQLNMTVLHEDASVAQRIAHRFSTPMVAGSNPAGGTEFDTDTGMSSLPRHNDRARRTTSKDPRAVGSLVNPSGWGPGNRAFESRQPDQRGGKSTA